MTCIPSSIGTGKLSTSSSLETEGLGTRGVLHLSGTNIRMRLRRQSKSLMENLLMEER
nr:uncharacterized protein LOC103449659 [Ipomoea batatas]GMC54608.1 uncharacterized protein LOC103449659 [Ipomoea batatas]GMC55210.1 uncharacterized protein LOC103449659 [Ipomoea batatas]GMC56440.1 uncharacterized protein LOC103449659 [Ipomoea batatas]